MKGLPPSLVKLERETRGGSSIRPSWNVMLAEAVFAPLPPYPWLIPGIHLAPGRVTLLNGYADTGKTVIAMTVALAVAAGQPLWGLFRPSRAGVVLHMNGELGSYIARERYQRLARAASIEPAELVANGNLRLANYPAVRFDDRDFEAEMIRACEGVTLVIIDSLRAFSGALDENSKEIGVALLMLARVSELTGATIVVLHHNRKPSKDDVGGAKMSISGSSSILGGSECAFVMAAEVKGGPVIVKHERSPIGRPLEDFGLTIEDVPSGSDPRWGLRVRHLDRKQMREAEEAAEKLAAAEQAVQIELVVNECLQKYAGRFSGSLAELQDDCGAKVRPAVFNNVVKAMLRRGTLVKEGTYHSPIYVLFDVNR